MQNKNKEEDKAEIKKKNETSLLSLFLAFFKIGLTTFGGGVAMLTNLQRELVEKRHWLTDDELYDYMAIAQCTPGIIMVNSATLLGAKKHSFLGSLISTIAVVLPSLIIITLIAFLLGYFSNLSGYISKFLIGMRIAVCATSLKTIVKMAKNNVKGLWGIILFLVFMAYAFLPVAIPSLKSANPFCHFIFSNTATILVVLSIGIGLLLGKKINPNQIEEISKTKREEMDDE